MENITHFQLDESKCIGCGTCVKVCSGMILRVDENKKARIADVEEFGWNGCWKCQHCMAVCPKGAISIFDKDPKDSLLPPGPEAADVMDSIIMTRRSCRRYLDKNVDKKTVDGILRVLQNAPTGGNAQNIELTVIDDKDSVKKIWEVAYKKMEEQAKEGIYGYDIGPEYYSIMKKSEQNLRPGDQLFCTAPHLFIAHQLMTDDSWAKDNAIDVDITSTYFELLCASRGLGVNMMSYTVGVIENMPEIKSMMGIPEDHYVGLIIGFGYPEIHYARGVQREMNMPVHRVRIE